MIDFGRERGTAREKDLRENMVIDRDELRDDDK